MSGQHPYARFAPPSSSSSASSSSSNTWGRPSFSHSSTSSLPGALGISSSLDGQQKQPQTIPFGLPSEADIARDRSPSRSSQHQPHAGSTAVGGPAFYTLSSDSSSSSLHARSSNASGYGSQRGIGGPSAGSGAGAMGIAGSSQRDFLVPIGSTGARQKLSILSPSQRRVASSSGSAGAAGETSTSSQYSSPLRGSSSGSGAATSGTMSASSSASSLPSSSSYSMRQTASQSPTTSIDNRRDMLTPSSSAGSNRLKSAGSNDYTGDSSYSSTSNTTPPRPARSGQRQGSISSQASSSQSHATSSSSAARRDLVYSPPTTSPTQSPPSSLTYSSGSMATTTTPYTSPAPHPYAPSPATRSRPSLPEDFSGRPDWSRSDPQQTSSRDAPKSESQDNGDVFGGKTTPTLRSRGSALSNAGAKPRSSQSSNSSAPVTRNRSVTPTQDNRAAGMGQSSRSAADAAAGFRGDAQASHYRSESGPATSPSSWSRSARSEDPGIAATQTSTTPGSTFTSYDTLNESAKKESSGGIKGRLGKMLGSSSKNCSNSSIKANSHAPTASDYGSKPKQYVSSDSLRSGMGMRKTESSSSIKSIGGSGHRMGSSASQSTSSPGPAILPAGGTGSPASSWRGGSTGPVLSSRSRSNTASSAAASTYSDRGPSSSNESPHKTSSSSHLRSPSDRFDGDPTVSSDLAGGRLSRGTSADHLGGSSTAATDPYDRDAIGKPAFQSGDIDVAPALNLNLRSTDFGDLQSMMPASYMGTRSDLLAPVSTATAASMDKSLPPTPNAESPRTSQTIERPAEVQASTTPQSAAPAERRPSVAGSATSRVAPQVEAVMAPARLQSSSSQQAETAVTSGQDPRMYIPPGALSFNRKGIAVRDKPTNGGYLGLPSDTVNQSRFSSSTNDVDSLKSPAPGALSGPTTSGTRLSLRSLENSTQDSHDSDSGALANGRSSFPPTDSDIDRGSLLPSSAWSEVESALYRFKEVASPSSSASPTQAAMDKGALIRNVLLPFLALEAETPNLAVTDGKYRSAKTRRGLFFDWIANLLIELQRVQTSADRGAILESIACIIESRNLSPQALKEDGMDEAKFGSTFGHILLYAIGELNKKGVYQNTLIFSGRLLAVAFFRVPGVASKLLRALPINRFALERVAAEAGWERVVPTPFELFKESFPETLREYCFYDARSYLKVLDSPTTSNEDRAGRQGNPADGDESDDDDRFLVRQPEVQVEMSGNWLRRWQSDDSELFFSFCRSYHRQLAGLLTSTQRLRKISPLFFGGPGYAHLATCIHLKCLSLVNRDILSVTTLSSQKTFNPGETANVLSGSTAGKPRHLEAANRRCTAIIVDIVRAPSGNNQVFVPMLGVHIKCLVKRTSLYDVQGVFCLLDWLDGVLGHMDAAELSIEGLVDINFVITTLGLLLEKADHALALMRAIAFSYSNFAVLISTASHRKRFCEEILLNPRIFQKLFLSWSFTIRAYFLHLLVFRLARIGDFPQAQGDDEVGGGNKTAVEIARVFNVRLDEIRKRHEELSPVSPGSADDEDEGGADGDDAKSTTSRRPPSFVSTIRRTPSIVNVDVSSGGHGNATGAREGGGGGGGGAGMTKAERVLGIGVPDPILANNKGRSASGGRRFVSSEEDSFGGNGVRVAGGKGQSRAAKWLRALGGKGGKKGGGSSMDSPSGSSTSSFGGSYDSPQISNRPRFKQMASLSEMDFSDDDDEEGEMGDEDDNDDDDADLDSPDIPPNPQAHNAVLDPSAPASGSSGIDPTLHGDNIAMDTTFDLQSGQSVVPATGAAPSSTLGAGGSATSSPPRMPRAFSKRTSILPGPAYDLVEHDEEQRGKIQADQAKVMTAQRNGYAQSQHVYATQGLREWEAVLAEHDEFFATMADGNGPPAVPRLPVQWPAMWSD
ncbi:hypothetical protein BDZ90DRAFT_234070 [Jaminaea rosea]|uniref:DUF1765-domain-containing protein n=1 Tax=Jaminaea rosea TaxID=1569628 RepID=A0A316UL19_9BASI|nr:hypothetical protein BDZ90DRAFT_234070 [Jaminaea rosea]PWN25634.1 hypothetical protein BDZ90DRAFT_234070 [Jaminaea rosea]